MFLGDSACLLEFVIHPSCTPQMDWLVNAKSTSLQVLLFCSFGRYIYCIEKEPSIASTSSRCEKDFCWVSAFFFFNEKGSAKCVHLPLYVHMGMCALVYIYLYCSEVEEGIFLDFIP